MDSEDPQHVLNPSYLTTLEDARRKGIDAKLHPSMQAVYIYFPLPIGSRHCVGVQISTIPFSLRQFPGQVFYCVEGSIIRCCSNLPQDEILAPVSEAAEIIYGNSVPWHKWNLRAPGVWREVSQTSKLHISLDSCTDSINEQLKQVVAMSQTSDLEFGNQDPLCMVADNRSTGVPNYRYQSSSPGSGASYNAPSFGSAIAAEIGRFPKRRRKASAETQGGPVTETADTFLERLNSATTSDIDILSYMDLASIKDPLLRPRGEHVLRAWEMCVSFARQSSQKLRYGRFLRFLSLCFFLIWERYSSKQGKSAAREVNAKMREAGFSGNSRGLKTMRDETTLINTVIASIQVHRGFEQAGILYHTMFEAANYQLIRTINRLSKDKQAAIIEYTCNHIDVHTLAAYPPTTTMDIQSIIKQYLPDLSKDAINTAIGYHAVDWQQSGLPLGKKHTSIGVIDNSEIPLSASNPGTSFSELSAGMFSGHEVEAVGLEAMHCGHDAFLGDMNFDFIFNDTDMGEVVPVV